MLYLTLQNLGLYLVLFWSRDSSGQHFALVIFFSKFASNIVTIAWLSFLSQRIDYHEWLFYRQTHWKGTFTFNSVWSTYTSVQTIQCPSATQVRGILYGVVLVHKTWSQWCYDGRITAKIRDEEDMILVILKMNLPGISSTNRYTLRGSCSSWTYFILM